jgi:hypothetical protein
MSTNINVSKKWIPEIVYEDDENGMTSRIPFVMVPKEEKMPKILFMFESRETGEFEPDIEGNPLPIVDMELHQYADMSFLKKGLSADLYDKVRICLGLKSLKEAVTAGSTITNKIRENLEK